MAWCRSCERYLAPAALTAEGACPSCDREVQHRAPPQAQSGSTATRIPSGLAPPQATGGTPASGRSAQGPSADPAAERIPWHFWLLLAAAAVYLGWRAVQGVALLL